MADIQTNLTNQYHHLRNAGSEDMMVNGAVTPVVFEHEVTDRAVRLNRALIHIADTVINRGDRLGNQDLANGCLFGILYPDGGTLDLLDDVEIEDNNALRALCYDYEPSAWSAGGSQSATARWTFAKDGGGKGLYLPVGSKIQFTIQDDLTGMDNFLIKIRLA